MGIREGLGIFFIGCLVVGSFQNRPKPDSQAMNANRVMECVNAQGAVLVTANKQACMEHEMSYDCKIASNTYTNALNAADCEVKQKVAKAKEDENFDPTQFAEEYKDAHDAVLAELKK